MFIGDLFYANIKKVPFCSYLKYYSHYCYGKELCYFSLTRVISITIWKQKCSNSMMRNKTVTYLW